MSRTVHCKKYQQTLPGLDAPPLPGQLGQDIYNEVSAQAWKEWQVNQTMLINEYRLNLVDPKARAFLTTELQRFLDNEDYAKPNGYVPPES